MGSNLYAMKFILINLLILASTNFCKAQYYSFSHFTEPYLTFTDGTLMDFDSICYYQNLPPLVSIGFQMPYFQRFLSSIHVDQSFLLSDNLSTVPGQEILGQLFPFGANYNPNPTTNSAARFKTVGQAGLRIFKLQFEELTIQNDSIGNDRCNYQVWMYEENGRIEFRTGAYQITQDDGYFTFENGVLSGILLYDQSNDVVLPGSIFLSGAADAPTPFYNSTVNFIPTVIGHPTEGRVYRFDNTSLGIKMISANNSFQIYPNPTTSKIEIKGNFIAPTTFFLYDSKSQLLGKYAQQIISVENLQSGIYFVVAKNSDGLITEKFIKD